MTALLAVDGPDGSGKSTLARALAAALSDLGARSWHHGPPLPMRPRDPWSMALHYAAERASLAAAIRDGVEAPTIIVDRFWHTAEVFAEVRGDGAARALAGLEAEVLPRPVLTVVLDAPDEVLAARRPDATPDEVAARALYRERRRLARWGAVTVDATQAPDALAAQVEAMAREALRGTTR